MSDAVIEEGTMGEAIPDTSELLASDAPPENVAVEDTTVHAQDQGEVNSHPVYLCGSSNELWDECPAGSRQITMVCESVNCQILVSYCDNTWDGKIFLRPGHGPRSCPGNGALHS